MVVLAALAGGVGGEGAAAAPPWSMPSICISVRSSYMNEATSGWRSAGSFAVARAMISSARSSSSGTSFDGLGIGAWRCWRNTSFDLADERQLAGEQLEEHDAHRVDVGGLRGRRAVDALGREVLRRAVDAVGAAEVGARQAEVEQLDDAALRGRADEEDVLGLDVAVEDLARVDEAGGVGDLPHDVAGDLGEILAASGGAWRGWSGPRAAP